MINSALTTDPRLLVLRDEDNIIVACTAIKAGTSIVIDAQTVTLNETVFVGHKIARRTIQVGEKILKYGAPIGSATQKITQGESVHTHNLKSDYIASYTLDEARTNSLEDNA
jgi:altronate dehydratase small subunit